MHRRPTAFAATPIVVEDTLYYRTPFNRVFALDPATGKELWVYDPGVNMSNEIISNCRGVGSWIDTKAPPGEERPVPQQGAVPGEYLSATRPFPLKPEALHPLGLPPEDAWGLTFWDRGVYRKKLESMRTGSLYIPPSLEGTVLYPSNLGEPGRD